MDKLQITNHKELGETLIKAAVESRRKNFQDSVVGIVETLLDSKTQIEADIKRSKENLALVEGRLAAIEAGAFDVDVEKHQIIYEDEKLRRSYS